MDKADPRRPDLISRLSGCPTFKNKKVDLEKLLTDTLPCSMRSFQGGRIEVVVRHPLSTVCADEALWIQVLANVSGNALKPVPPGVKPRVEVWTEEGAGKTRIWVKVGLPIGIKPEFQSRIFGMFERAHQDPRVEVDRHRPGHRQAGPGKDGRRNWRGIGRRTRLRVLDRIAIGILTSDIYHDICYNDPSMILLVEDEDDDVFFMEWAMRKVSHMPEMRRVCNGREAIEYFQGTGKFADPCNIPFPTWCSWI